MPLESAAGVAPALHHLAEKGPSSSRCMTHGDGRGRSRVSRISFLLCPFNTAQLLSVRRRMTAAGDNFGCQ
jgi:hypothetical protein